MPLRCARASEQQRVLEHTGIENGEETSMNFNYEGDNSGMSAENSGIVEKNPVKKGDVNYMDAFSGSVFICSSHSFLRRETFQDANSWHMVSWTFPTQLLVPRRAW